MLHNKNTQKVAAPKLPTGGKPTSKDEAAWAETLEIVHNAFHHLGEMVAGRIKIKADPGYADALKDRPELKLYMAKSMWLGMIEDWSDDCFTREDGKCKADHTLYRCAFGCGHSHGGKGGEKH